MSEIKRAARSLVETREESFPSRHPRGEADARLADTLSRARIAGATRFSREWRVAGHEEVLAVRFAPPPSTRLFLHALSLAIALLLGASAWSLLSEQAGRTAAVLWPLVTLLAILGLPFVTLGLASRRDAEEARIRKAIRVALQDAEEKLPPRQAWADED